LTLPHTLSEPSPWLIRTTRGSVTVKDVNQMLRADELTVVRHDDTEIRFLDVRYTLTREGLHVVTAAGVERLFARHDVLTTHVRLKAVA
jgi:hypothetical protein